MKDIKSRLLEAGGKLWEKGGRSRIYINGDSAIESVFGLSLKRYGTGNILSAELNGEKISNSKARKIVCHNPYYDCIANKWVDIGCEPLDEFLGE